MVAIYNIAIFLLIILETCLSQRKVSRSESSGNEAKPVLNFNCPEEFGYYPHPSDCTQYYVCVFGGALLESCTGGLMYSHELQTCDWPRNVGCDIAEVPGSVTVTNPSNKLRDNLKTRYSVSTPTPPQPSAVVTSRGQSRQLNRNQHEIIKQRQRQLYEDTEETLPPAEELESDRQQRVYRGQPSTVGQVQKDRDGIRNSNAIPIYSGRSEKVSVISFGSSDPQLQKYRLQLDNILTNDLTMKRRRKRQISQIGPFDTWNGNQKNLKTFHKNLTSQLKSFTYSPEFTQLNNNDFIPFVPRYPLYTTARVKPYKPWALPTTNRHYYTRITTFRPLIHIPKHDNFMIPQHTHIINTTFKQESSNSNTLPPTFENNESANKESHEKLNIKEDYYDENFGPPLSYFNLKNKYENIENPFANPDFDFDKFLSSLRDETSTVDSEKVTAKATSDIEIEPKTPEKNQDEDDYYYESSTEENKTNHSNSKSKFSSKVKPTAKTLLFAPANDEDYDSSYEPPQEYFLKNPNITRDNAGKYSSKYSHQQKPSANAEVVHIIGLKNDVKNITKRPAVAEGIVSKRNNVSYITYTTTEKPNYTTDYELTLTVPTTVSLRNDKQTDLPDDDLTFRIEQSSAAPVQAPISITTVTTQEVYNNSKYNDKNNLNKNRNNNYDSYYTLYDDDIDVYRDIDYSQQYTNNNNAEPSQSAQLQSYRRTLSPSIETNQDESSKRGSSTYIHNNFNSPDAYQPTTRTVYNDDKTYNTQLSASNSINNNRSPLLQNEQLDFISSFCRTCAIETSQVDQNSYTQSNRHPARKSANNLNYFEESPTKRTTTTTTTIGISTNKPTYRAYPTKKNSGVSKLPITGNENTTQAPYKINTLQEDTGPFPLTPRSTFSHNDADTELDKLPDSNSKLPITNSDDHVYKPDTFLFPPNLTTENSVAYHYITKASRSTTIVSKEKTTESSQKARKVLAPTTYSPPFIYFESLLRKSSSPTNIPIKTESIVTKSSKSVPKVINPVHVNYELTSVPEYEFTSEEESLEPATGSYDYSDDESSVSDNFSTSSEPESNEFTREININRSNDNNSLNNSKVSSVAINLSKKLISIDTKLSQSVIEKPLNINSKEKNLNQHSNFKNKIYLYTSPLTKITTTATTTTLPITTKAAKIISNALLPTRVSKPYTIFKSQIPIGRPQKQVKCYENPDAICNESKYQRTNAKTRGSTHYSNAGNVINNEVTLTINRGTPASRPRPTLKPSTSIVSKASEFIDIYRFPPIRPEPIYPQPQPDKTAAKCRKDVCLLPDCYCGGKEIPGSLPVEETPQIVLLTFDDAVNDLNKQYYSELFENGRHNPNGCPISATFYISHEWTDYSQVQNLYADGHEMASHTVSHSFGEQFSQKKWTREVAGQREILSAYGGVRLEDVRGMRAPFLSVGGNKMFKMLYDSNFTYDSSMPIYENKPPSWPYTLDYKLFHDCMIPPCPTRSYPGVWEVPMVMWQDLNGGRCSMGDACSNPPDSEGVFRMLTKNFQRHYTTNRAPFGLFYHAAWFTQPHHKEGFINFLDSILEMKDVWLVTNWQAIQWIRDPTPVSRLNSFRPFQCDYSNRPKRCNNPKVCNLWHKSGVRYMRTCQPCPDIYPWTGNTGIRNSRVDNDIED